MKCTMWALKVMSCEPCFIHPMNSTAISTINHDCWSYKPTWPSRRPHTEDESNCSITGKSLFWDWRLLMGFNPQSGAPCTVG